MTDAPSDEPASTTPPMSGEVYSKEFVDQMKAELATLKQRTIAMEVRDKAELERLQPEARALIQDVAAERPDWSSDIARMTDWADSAANGSNPGESLPLMRLISCASAKLKRTRDEAHANGTATTELQSVCKEKDVLADDNAKLKQRVDELEKYGVELKGSNDKLAAIVAKHEGVQEKFDFSKASSRETNGSGAGSSSNAPLPNANPLSSEEFSLASFINKNGMGGGQFMPSASQHGLVGGGQPHGRAAFGI